MQVYMVLVGLVQKDPLLVYTCLFNNCFICYFVYSTFYRIFSGEDQTCLKVVGDSVSVQTGNAMECLTGDETSLFWQWWPLDTTHLVNVATQLCLTSAFPFYDVIKRGHSNITVEQCSLGNKRQV